MKLNKNERLTLELLVKNPQITNLEISKELGITTQAVGKIKRQLQRKGIIKGYETVIDYEKLGITLFAVALIKIMPSAFKKYNEKQLNKLLQPPNVITAYTLPQTNVTHIIVYAFRSIEEADNYFRLLKTELADLIEIRESFIFSNKSLIKDSPKDLLVQVLEEMGKEKIMPKPIKPEE